MKATYVTDGRSITPSPEDLLPGIFELRHAVFKERLRWNVDSVGNQEVDHYDHGDVSYIVHRKHCGQVNGCWRSIPTTSPYMLENNFLEILDGHAPPKRADVWEISRFAVEKTDSSIREKVTNSVTVNLVRSMWHFAKQKSVTEYVAVTSVACEKILAKLGVTANRIGSGNPLDIGGVMSVAISINVDDKLLVPSLRTESIQR